jgi:L-asparaginase II
LLAASIRSGLVETTHQGAVAALSADGAVLASFGDIDRPFYLRSSAKPFQAAVSQAAGAGLDPLELAMACASHRGFPVHIALVESMLSRAGLDEGSLRCPRDWPLAPGAARLVARSGENSPRRVWHNCSGKHAGFLRACSSQGWPLDSYLSPEHPLQRRVIELVSELGELSVQPVGVDGCGAPVLRTTCRAMAWMFARLATESSLDPVFSAMHRYPALVGANGEGDTEIAIALDAVAKGGAAGCVGVGLAGRLGVAAKSWDGLGPVANLAAASALEQLDVLSPTAARSLQSVLAPTVLGGAVPVGSLDAHFRLDIE